MTINQSNEFADINFIVKISLIVYESFCRVKYMYVTEAQVKDSLLYNNFRNIIIDTINFNANVFTLLE